MADSITLRDVADFAGVSIGTASQALNNRPNVASDTRARVIDAARTLGYSTKKLSADQPGNSELEVIGLLVKHDYGFAPEVNPFYSHIQAGVENECRNRGISLMYANIEVDVSNHPVMWPAMVEEQRIDGLILAGTFLEGSIDGLKRKLDIPIVLVDSYAPGLSFDSVVIDNTPAAFGAVEYLIQQGHRHIGLIGAHPKSPPSILERQEGYLRALRVHDIPDVYVESSHLVRLDREAGYEATQHLLERAPEVTAVFACNDMSAIGVLHAARDMGRDLPAELSVVGFDNVDLAKETYPALSTVHVHKTWMGTLAVRQVLERAESPDQPKITIVVSTQFIARDSVRSCAV